MMAQGGSDPTLRYQNGVFNFGLVARLSRAGRHDGDRIMGGHVEIRAVQFRFVAAGTVDAGAGIIWNDQLRNTLEILEGRHMTVNPVPQVLAQRGPYEGVGAGTQNGDEQRSRGDVTDAPVVDRDRVSGPVHEHLLAGAMLLAQHYILVPAPAIVQLTEAAVAITIGLSFAIFFPD